jgi:hypothetical protein
VCEHGVIDWPCLRGKLLGYKARKEERDERWGETCGLAIESITYQLNERKFLRIGRVAKHPFGNLMPYDYKVIF